MMDLIKPAGAIALGLLVSGCADEPYQPILDGPASLHFNQDLAECRQVSAQAQKTNAGATGGAIVGGLIGASESKEDALAGAVIGGLLGSAEESAEVDEKRDQIVFNCMRGRGHNVVG